MLRRLGYIDGYLSKNLAVDAGEYIAMSIHIVPFTLRPNQVSVKYHFVTVYDPRFTVENVINAGIVKLGTHIRVKCQIMARLNE